MNSVLPPADPRPYYRGRDKKKDEELVRELFYGRNVTNQKTGRIRHEYFKPDSPDERRAFEVLTYLLMYALGWKALSGEFDEDIYDALMNSLRGRGRNLGRRLVFKRTKQPPRSNWVEDSKVSLHVRHRRIQGWKKEAAVQDAMTKFGLSRKTVYRMVDRHTREMQRSIKEWRSI